MQKDATFRDSGGLAEPVRTGCRLFGSAMSMEKRGAKEVPVQTVEVFRLVGRGLSNSQIAFRLVNLN